MPDCEQTSEQLHTVVSLSAGIGDSVRFLQTNAVSPVTKLKEALTSKETYSKYYLVSVASTSLKHIHIEIFKGNFLLLLLCRSYLNKQ